MLNQLPAELKDEMQEHLRLKFNNQEASDDQVGVCFNRGLKQPNKWHRSAAHHSACRMLGHAVKLGGWHFQQQG